MIETNDGRHQKPEAPTTLQKPRYTKTKHIHDLRRPQLHGRALNMRNTRLDETNEIDAGIAVLTVQIFEYASQRRLTQPFFINHWNPCAANHAFTRIIFTGISDFRRSRASCRVVLGPMRYTIHIWAAFIAMAAFASCLTEAYIRSFRRSGWDLEGTA